MKKSLKLEKMATLFFLIKHFSFEINRILALLSKNEHLFEQES